MEKYYFKHSGLSFDKDPEDENKYIVFACAKNEEEYIVEWIEHYFNLGFDKIIIADNNDVGNDSLYEKVHTYVEDGRIQIFDCRGVYSVQVGLYADYCEEGNFKWCAFYDCDEFLEIGAYKNVKDYLAQEAFYGYDIVLLNWLVFGPNGQIKKEKGTVQERFKMPQSPLLYFKENAFVKSLVRGDKEKYKGCFFNGSHIPTPAEGKSFNVTVAGYYTAYVAGHAYFHPRYKNGYIKHYYTKSFEEWVDNKANRGWPDGTDNLILSKYLTFNDGNLVPFNFMDKSLFKVDNYSAYKQFENELKGFDVILIRSEGEFIYPLFTEMMDIFQKLTNHTFLFTDKAIDDTMFNILLEYAYATGNRAIFCKNQQEIWSAYEKYGKLAYTYFVITFG